MYATSVSRRSFLTSMAGTAAAACLPHAVNAIAAEPNDKINLAMQAIDLAEDILLEMRNTPDPDDEDYLDPDDFLLSLSCAMACQMQTLRSVFFQDGEGRFPVIETIRKHRTRYEENRPGLERAFLSLTLACETLESLFQDSLHEDCSSEILGERGVNIKGVLFTVRNAWLCLESTILGFYRRRNSSANDPKSEAPLWPGISIAIRLPSTYKLGTGR